MTQDTVPREIWKVGVPNSLLPHEIESPYLITQTPSALTGSDINTSTKELLNTNGNPWKTWHNELERWGGEG